MQKITRTLKDYHGLTVDQAIADLEEAIATDDSMVLEIILGHGRIRIAVIDWLNENNIEWNHLSAFNHGCIEVWLELVERD